MSRFGYTYPEATQSLGLMRVERSGAVGLITPEITMSLGESARGGMDLSQLGIVQNVITRSLGDAGTTGAVLLSATVAGVLAASVTAIGFASYQRHGSPLRAGLVAGGFVAGLSAVFGLIAARTVEA